ncbi:hypothetical protein P280DRAFT_537858 [Massarina eburnea CBS 473.64]|uniref:Uncharacterized protein n=1 Tax=Massarina eburnea CBS 473.64 TaxID=1395130 RepID=A0A6A6S8N3_9PLEO|nr:hypothetical protein P280DRAFT_537858 [Massarina eburnea CBS 473.64]
MAAFNPKETPVDVPIVQVSLFGSEDVEKHYRLGKSLQRHRYYLRDYRATRGTGKDVPYSFSSDKALAKPEEREKRMTDLIHRSYAREAHPSLEHLLPVYVAAGAAGEDVGQRVWTLVEGSLDWAQYRFGKAKAVWLGLGEA